MTMAYGNQADMEKAIMAHKDEADYIFMTAAVADFTPAQVATEKIKKKDASSTLELKRTTDILKTLGQNKKPSQFLCGFSMETENMLENSRKKLEEKKADLLVANSLRQEGAGFGSDTNIVTLITKDKVWELPMMSKEEVAHKIIDACVDL